MPANAGISYARGKDVDLAELAVSLVPGVGAAAKALKFGEKALGKIAAAERTILAVSDAYNVAAGAAAGAAGVYDGAKKLAAGDTKGGLMDLANAGLELAGAAGSIKGAMSLKGRYSQCQDQRIHPWTLDQSTCFTAGTPVRVPGDEWAKAIEQFQPGDRILTKPQFRPEAEVTVGVVVDVFTRVSRVLHVTARGITIEATPEHPLWVRGSGWKPAGEVAAGDELMTSTGAYVVCESVVDSGRVETVYNLTVEGDHTYFVGGDTWGFDVWVHNAKVMNYGKSASAQALAAKNAKVAKKHPRGKPRFENGNEKEGWIHIEMRHMPLPHPPHPTKGKADLFAAGTTRDQLENAAQKILDKGRRVSDPKKTIQTFTHSMKVNGLRAKFGLTVDAKDSNRVITIFPMLGGS